MAYIGSKPADKVLTASDITDGVVSNAKLAQDIISADTALGATPADTDELLVSDAGVLKRMDYSYIKSTNTPAFEATRGSNQTISHDTETKVACDVETFDTASAYDNSTNYRWTPQTAGKYYIYAQATATIAQEELKRYSLIIKKNGNNYKYQSNYFTGNPAYKSTIYIGSVIDMDGSSDYVELYGKIEYSSSGTVIVSGDSVELTFGGYKLIE